MGLRRMIEDVRSSLRYLYGKERPIFWSRRYIIVKKRCDDILVSVKVFDDGYSSIKKLLRGVDYCGLLKEFRLFVKGYDTTLRIVEMTIRWVSSQIFEAEYTVYNEDAKFVLRSTVGFGVVEKGVFVGLRFRYVVYYPSDPSMYENMLMSTKTLFSGDPDEDEVVRGVVERINLKMREGKNVVVDNVDELVRISYRMFGRIAEILTSGLALLELFP